MVYLDSGYYEVTAARAAELVGGVAKLPRVGRECLVEMDGEYWWLSRKMFYGKPKWSVRNGGGWKLVDGRAVLGG